MLLRKTSEARSPCSTVTIRWQCCTTCCVGITYFSLGLTYVTSWRSSLDQAANNWNRIFAHSRHDKLLRVSLYVPRKSQQTTDSGIQTYDNRQSYAFQQRIGFCKELWEFLYANIKHYKLTRNTSITLKKKTGHKINQDQTSFTRKC